MDNTAEFEKALEWFDNLYERGVYHGEIEKYDPSYRVIRKLLYNAACRY